VLSREQSANWTWCRRPAACSLVLATCALWAAATAAAAPKIIGGTTIEIQQAPWQVEIEQESRGRTISSCGGSIIGPTQILTAAHCVFSIFGSPASPSAMVVRAGISNSFAPHATDAEQRSAVASYRIHPGYVHVETGSQDDVAVVTLVSPLDLSGPNARAIALPASGAVPATGSKVTVTGFGRQAPDTNPDGMLRALDLVIEPQADCGGENNAIVVCATATNSAICSGDSGSGLVEGSVVIGIASLGINRCPRGSTGVYTSVAAPEILRFVQGNDAPPAAPRRGGGARLESPTALQVGQTVHCEPGAWTGAPTFTYTFVDAGTGATLQRGKQDYILKSRDIGRRIGCRVAATNEGGTGIAEPAPTTKSVRAAPRLLARATPTIAGGNSVVAITLTGLRLVRGTAEICVTPALHIGTKSCSTTRLAGSANKLTSKLAVAIKAAAPATTARARVAAQLADGRRITTTALILIRG
jgi:hypothetical protein